MKPSILFHLLVHVDCTNIKTNFRQNSFKGSRDRFNEGIKTEILKEKIYALLKSNEELKRINQECKNLILNSGENEGKLLADGSGGMIGWNITFED